MQHKKEKEEHILFSIPQLVKSGNEAKINKVQRRYNLIQTYLNLKDEPHHLSDLRQTLTQVLIDTAYDFGEEDCEYTPQDWQQLIRLLAFLYELE